jgi:hypothetical protein
VEEGGARYLGHQVPGRDTEPLISCWYSQIDDQTVGSRLHHRLEVE